MVAGDVTVGRMLVCLTHIVVLSLQVELRVSERQLPWGGENLFQLPAYKSVTEGSQGKNMETKTDAAYCHVLHRLLSLLYYSPQDHQPSALFPPQVSQGIIIGINPRSLNLRSK